MSYVKGDRVRMRSNPVQVGTVTGERDQMFLSFVGVQWQSGDFGFVAPANLEWAGSNMTPEHIEAIEAIAGMSKADRVSLAAAHRMAMEAVAKTTGRNHTENGIEVTDWQTRAEQAEASMKTAMSVAKQDMRRAEQAEREASEWERSFNAERADKYMAEDAAKSWRLAAEAAEAKVAAVRDLHRPVPVYTTEAGDCEHDGDCEAVEISAGSYCPVHTDGLTCNECAELAEHADDLPAYPCSTIAALDADQ